MYFSGFYFYCIFCKLLIDKLISLVYFVKNNMWYSWLVLWLLTLHTEIYIVSS